MPSVGIPVTGTTRQFQRQSDDQDEDPEEGVKALLF
jgi:hypothetical protein